MQNPVQIYVNGQPRTVPSGSTLAVLMEDLGMAGRPVAVEVNRKLVPREAHGERRLHDGDQLEVVTLVGGG